MLNPPSRRVKHRLDRLFPASPDGYMPLEYRDSILNRREFLKGSAAMLASFAATQCPLIGANSNAGPASDSGLLLPPLLTRPTGSSICISAIHNQKDAQAFVQL